MTRHVPILVGPIVEALMEPFRRLPADAPPHWLLDCTLGGGGHTNAFLEAFASEPALRKHKVLSIDQDEEAVARAQTRFAREISEGRLEVRLSRISQAHEILEDGRPLLGMLADLGFSSDQIDDPDRGLSFMHEGPLDMRMDRTRGVSCEQYLRTVQQPELEGILRELGEERFAGRIASAILQTRREKRLPKTTRELAELIMRAVPPPARHGRIHAATRTFQALRIVVNEELYELDRLLEKVVPFLRPGGRVAILSFHSLEDRKVKLAFRGERDQPSIVEPLTKKPVEADEAEVAENPRARSAKLRVAERVEA